MDEDPIGLVGGKGGWVGVGVFVAGFCEEEDVLYAGEGGVGDGVGGLKDVGEDQEEGGAAGAAGT